VLCDGPIPSATKILTEIEAECFDVAGRLLPFDRMQCIERNDSRFWLIWYCPDSALADRKARGLAEFNATKFSPRRLRLLRKEDHRELTMLELRE